MLQSAQNGSNSQSFDPKGSTMQTLNPGQYGGNGNTSDSSQNASPSPIDYIKQYASDVGKDYEDAIPDFLAAAGSGQHQAGELDPLTGKPINGFEAGVANVEEGALRSTASGLNTIFAPVTEAVKTASDAISNSPQVQDFVTKNPVVSNVIKFLGNPTENFMNWLGSDDPAAKDLNAALTVGLTAAGGVVEGEGSVRGNNADMSASMKPTPQSTPVANTPIKIGINDSTPNYSPKMIGQTSVDADGNVIPRVNENEGLLGNRTVNSTQSEIDAGNETVKNYPIKGTNLDKYNAVMKEASDEADSLRTKLQAQKNVISPDEMFGKTRAAVMDAADRSMLLNKSSAAVKNYLRVARQLADNVKPNSEGVLDYRQGLDEAYENIRGNKAYPAGSDKVMELDQLHRAGRTAANNLLDETSKDAGVKSSLQRQTNLYRAAEVLRDKAEEESGNKAQRFVDAHPSARFAVHLGNRIFMRSVTGGIITTAKDLLKGKTP